MAAVSMHGHTVVGMVQPVWWAVTLAEFHTSYNAPMVAQPQQAQCTLAISILTVSYLGAISVLRVLYQ